MRFDANAPAGQYGSVNLKELLSAIEYRVVRTREEMHDAYSLVYKEYFKRGYMQENPAKMRISYYNVIPQTTTFVGVVGKGVISTATVIQDSPLGLPMDEIYAEELAPLRKQNKKICEVSMLASDTDLFSGGVSLMLNAKKMFFIFLLFKLILDYTKDVLGLDYLCITVNPKHRLTYDFLLFKDLGGLKTYKHANDAPAIAKYVDLNTAEEDSKARDRRGMVKMFFAGKTDPSKFADRLIFSEDDLRYFFVEKTNILRRLTKEELDYVKSCYPNYDFKKILK